jgi:Uncharacterized conserved protein (DUF2190)
LAEASVSKHERASAPHKKGENIMGIGPVTGTIKSATAGAAIQMNTILKFGDLDSSYMPAPMVVPATGPTDVLVAVAEENANEGQDLAIAVLGDSIRNIKLGDAVAAGNLITSDANGNGVPANPAPGVNNYVIGMALGPGVAGDIIAVTIAPQRIQG